jgi:hypothetical protein
VAKVTIIEPPSGGNAPVAYQLAPGLTLETLAVAADFDGSGAGGDFEPAVAFYAQDGRRLGRFAAGTAITAGSSAEVTFFPFAPPASSGGGSATQVVEQFDVYGSPGILGLAAGAFGFMPFQFQTGSQDPAHIMDLTTPTAPKLPKGLYLISWQVEATSSLVANKMFGVEVKISTPINYLSDIASAPGPAGYFDPLAHNNMITFSFVWPVKNDGTVLQMTVGNGDTVLNGFILNYFNLVQLTGLTLN